MTPYTTEDYAWIERLRQQMKGYWIRPSGSLEITFYVPTRWERFCAWWCHWYWVPFK